MFSRDCQCAAICWHQSCLYCYLQPQGDATEPAATVLLVSSGDMDRDKKLRTLSKVGFIYLTVSLTDQSNLV